MKISDLLESDNKDSYVFTGLYHSSNDHGDIVYKPPVNQERKPKNTPIMFHDYVNELSIKRFGIPIRNSIFALTQPGNGYGENVFKVEILPEYTRIFVEPQVKDFTVSIDLFATTLSDMLRLTIKKNFNGIDTSLKFPVQAYQFNNVIRQYSTSFNELLNAILALFDKTEYTNEQRKVVHNIIIDCFDEYRNKLQVYIDHVEEIGIDEVQKYKQAEFMIYTTHPVKLVHVDKRTKRIP